MVKVNKSNTSLDFTINADESAVYELIREIDRFIGQNAEESAVYELIRETDRFIGQRETISRLTLMLLLRSLLLDTVNQVRRCRLDGTIFCRLHKLSVSRLKVEIDSDLPEIRLIWEFGNE